MSALPVGRPQRKTFGEYIEGPWVDPVGDLDDEFARRLEAAADDIDTLPKLQTWARHRFPTWYTCRGGEAYDGPTGKQVMALLWADYLAWAEAA